jgi:hypothetical protein
VPWPSALSDRGLTPQEAACDLDDDSLDALVGYLYRGQAPESATATILSHAALLLEGARSSLQRLVEPDLAVHHDVWFVVDGGQRVGAVGACLRVRCTPNALSDMLASSAASSADETVPLAGVVRVTRGVFPSIIPHEM